MVDIDGELPGAASRGSRTRSPPTSPNNGDVGASVAVTLDGELVVDLWGGTLDEAGTTPWERDTIINVFSTTKTMSCLSLLVLASRGLVDVDAPVERYWPEFGANGKGNVLVRHLLSHTAGLPAWEQRIETADLYDWDKVCGLLAEQATWWEPGWKSGLPRRLARATSSARWSAASTAARSARSSPRRSPARSAPTSTSARPPSATTASPW